MDGAAVKTALKKAGKKKKGEDLLPRVITGDDSDSFVPVLAFECRGLEPYAFHPMSDEFVVTSTGGVEFDDDVDLSDGDWAEYDDENDASVSISSFESKLITM